MQAFLQEWILYILGALVFIAAIQTYHGVRRKLSSKYGPDMPLSKVISYVVGPQGCGHEAARSLLEELRKEARLGRIEVWGKPGEPSAGLNVSPPESIPQSYWRENTMDLLSLTAQSDRTVPTDPAKIGRVRGYYDVTLSKEQVRQKWGNYILEKSEGRS